jgi:predicted RNase H-like HicB family nuclease
MTMYVGIVDGSGDVWGVRFPDVPGCIGAGATADAAIADATTALRDVMTFKFNGGFDRPRASTLADILASGEIEPGETAVLIPIILDQTAWSAPV